MIIKIDNLENEQVKQLLRQHLQEMRKNSPEESVHAMDIERLKSDDITFWTIWEDENIAGCGALKELSKSQGEIKSMRTHNSFLRKGVARKLLVHMIEEARKRGYKKLNLETGSFTSFIPAHELYRKFGFVECEPFGEYKEDPNSFFMTLDL